MKGTDFNNDNIWMRRTEREQREDAATDVRGWKATNMYYMKDPN